MKYYYDLKLNFQKDNCLFYEWSRSDDVITVKKIPCYCLDSQSLSDILSNRIKLDMNFTGDKLLLIDNNTAIALKLDKDGYEIARSFLSLEDELRIIDSVKYYDHIDVKYTKLDKIPYKRLLREEIIIKENIKKEITRIINHNDYQKLEYLYVEWFNELENNKERMLKKINSKLKGAITEDEIKINELIMLSYKNQ